MFTVGASYTRRVLDRIGVASISANEHHAIGFDSFVVSFRLFRLDAKPRRPRAMRLACCFIAVLPSRGIASTDPVPSNYL